MDGTHRLINQRRWKGRMLRRVFGETLHRALGCRERRDVSGMWEQMLAHRERERRAWPNLARLMKNGQESAYLARPSLHSTAASPHFLLPARPYPPCPFDSLGLSLILTFWSLSSPDNRPFSHKCRHPRTVLIRHCSPKLFLNKKWCVWLKHTSFGPTEINYKLYWFSLLTNIQHQVLESTIMRLVFNCMLLIFWREIL